MGTFLKDCNDFKGQGRLMIFDHHRDGDYPRDCGHPKEFYHPTGWVLSLRIVIILRDRDVS